MIQNKYRTKEYIIGGEKCTFWFDENNMCLCTEEVIDLVFGTYGDALNEITKQGADSIEDLIKKTRNKAIDDFVNALCSNEVIDKSVVRRCATQLKGSAE